HHHSGRAAARNANGEQRHHRAGGDAVIRRFRSDDTVGVAFPVEFWILRVKTRLLISYERGDAGPGTWQNADDQAEQAGPRDLPPPRHGESEIAPSFAPARDLVRGLVRDHKLLLNHHDGFRDGKQANKRGHKRYAVEKLEKSESATGCRINVIGSH